MFHHKVVIAAEDFKIEMSEHRVFTWGLDASYPIYELTEGEKTASGFFEQGSITSRVIAVIQVLTQSC